MPPMLCGIAGEPALELQIHVVGYESEPIVPGTITALLAWQDGGYRSLAVQFSINQGVVH